MESSAVFQGNRHENLSQRFLSLCDAVALGITAFAYYYARKHAYDPRYSFGTGKVSVLGGYTSSIVLGGVAFLMIAESVHRLISPASIRFNESILVAVIGLVVNLVSNSKGYYIATDNEEIVNYLKSLTQRRDAINALINSFKL